VPHHILPTSGAPTSGAPAALPDGQTRADLPDAVLWDMDGTLIDSEPYWMAAETELCTAHGVTWTYEDGLSLVGNPLPTSAEVLQARGLRLTVGQILDYLIARVAAAIADSVPWQPGARELLAELGDAGVPCALVTMSYQALVDPLVAAAPAGTFAATVSGQEVAHGKPHPEAYLTAAARLGVDITRCVAVEDSPAGLGSAIASGARVVGVQSVLPVAPAPGLSRVGSLADLGLEGLARVARGEVVDLIDAG